MMPETSIPRLLRTKAATMKPSSSKRRFAWRDAESWPSLAIAGRPPGLWNRSQPWGSIAFCWFRIETWTDSTLGVWNYICCSSCISCLSSHPQAHHALPLQGPNLKVLQPRPPWYPAPNIWPRAHHWLHVSQTHTDSCWYMVALMDTTVVNGSS